MAIHPLEPPPAWAAEHAPLAGARIVLCLALLGAVLGFLPHNFNPATIFLGDCGSHLLGYACVVIILMLGEYGQTHLVFAGLIVFSLPIMDTTLAIIRRWLAGTPMAAADDEHMHHQLKRALGVKQAVFAIYGIGFGFAVVGVTLAALVMLTQLRVRVVYAVALVLFGFIGVIAVKAARRKQLEAAAKSCRPSPAK
jgi:UDP-GlcNAc:undecaprenyl-phosphate GlcNAc-1-phosphate transferase